MLERHVLEAEALAEMLRPTGRWLDLGTGGGLPGLVLAWRHPAVSWTLLDATAKKIAAVAAFAEALDLGNVTPLVGRAEALAHDAHHREGYDGVVSRAVAPLATLAELCRGFVKPGGLIVAVKGPAWRQEFDEAAGAMGALRMDHVHTAQLPDAARETWVVTMRAVGPVPANFPRRNGVPRQDPLR